MSNTIETFTGDTITLKVVVSNSTAGPVDISDYEFFFTVKENDDDPDSKAVITSDVTSHTRATAGITTITATSDDTNVTAGVYVYDIQFKDVGGNITTAVKGDLVLKQGVTSRTSA